MRQEPWFCLFQGDAGPMAVSAESVAEVLPDRQPGPLGLESAPGGRSMSLPSGGRARRPIRDFAAHLVPIGRARPTRASGEKPDGDDRFPMHSPDPEDRARRLGNSKRLRVDRHEPGRPRISPRPARMGRSPCWPALSRTQGPATASWTSRRPGMACDRRSAAGTDSSVKPSSLLQSLATTSRAEPRRRVMRDPASRGHLSRWTMSWQPREVAIGGMTGMVGAILGVGSVVGLRSDLGWAIGLLAGGVCRGTGELVGREASAARSDGLPGRPGK